MYKTNFWLSRKSVEVTIFRKECNELLVIRYLTLSITVPDPSKGVCGDPANRGAILEGGGPGPPGGNKERQLSPDKGRGKT